MVVKENNHVICTYDRYNVPSAKNEVAKSVRRMITELQGPVAGPRPVRVISMELPGGGQVRVTVERV